MSTLKGCIHCRVTAREDVIALLPSGTCPVATEHEWITVDPGEAYWEFIAPRTGESFSAGTAWPAETYTGGDGPDFIVGTIEAGGSISVATWGRRRPGEEWQHVCPGRADWLPAPDGPRNEHLIEQFLQ